MRFPIANPGMLGCGDNVYGPSETKPITKEDLELGRAKSEVAEASALLTRMTADREALKRVLGSQKTQVAFEQAVGFLRTAEVRLASINGGVR